MACPSKYSLSFSSLLRFFGSSLHMARLSADSERVVMAKREIPENLKRDEKLNEYWGAHFDIYLGGWELYEVLGRHWEERLRMTFEDSEANQRLLSQLGRLLAWSAEHVTKRAWASQGGGMTKNA
jgi:hypothetical protein